MVDTIVTLVIWCILHLRSAAGRTVIVLCYMYCNDVLVPSSIFKIVQKLWCLRFVHCNLFLRTCEHSSQDDLDKIASFSYHSGQNGIIFAVYVFSLQKHAN